jgi:hypothetical protein
LPSFFFQRRVGNIVLFTNTDVPLDPDWNVTASPVVAGEEPLKIDAYLSAAFGYQVCCIYFLERCVLSTEGLLH